MTMSTILPVLCYRLVCWYLRLLLRLQLIQFTSTPRVLIMMIPSHLTHLTTIPTTSPMSLFGTSPDETPRRNVKSSLFDDEEAPARPGGSGLFADENQEDSPWAPTPRRQARANPVKTLLADAGVPESYIDAYDALLESGESAPNGVALSGVRRVLAGSSTSPATQQQILKLVQPQGEDAAGLGRAEFNVVLALIGLAQEGEELSLDSVDEHRRRMLSDHMAVNHTKYRQDYRIPVYLNCEHRVRLLRKVSHLRSRLQLLRYPDNKNRHSVTARTRIPGVPPLLKHKCRQHSMVPMDPRWRLGLPPHLKERRVLSRPPTSTHQASHQIRR